MFNDSYPKFKTTSPQLQTKLISTALLSTNSITLEQSQFPKLRLTTDC